MPVCFQLIDRTTGQPAVFQCIDAAICHNLNLPFRDDEYTCGWYDYHGFLLAFGTSFQQITNIIRNNMIRHVDKPDWLANDHDMLRINHYLLEHYESSAWWEPKS